MLHSMILIMILISCKLHLLGLLYIVLPHRHLPPPSLSLSAHLLLATFSPTFYTYLVPHSHILPTPYAWHTLIIRLLELLLFRLSRWFHYLWIRQSVADFKGCRCWLNYVPCLHCLCCLRSLAWPIQPVGKAGVHVITKLLASRLQSTGQWLADYMQLVGWPA